MSQVSDLLSLMADRRPADWPDNTGQWKGQVKGGGEGQSVSIP